MRLFLFLAFVAILIFLIVVAVPTQWLGVPGIFWFGLSFAFFLCDLLTGGYSLALPVARTTRPTA